MTRSGYGRLMTAAALSTLLLTACSAEDKPEQTSATESASDTAEKSENTLAMVNGRAITMDDLTFFITARQEANPRDQSSPEVVLNELVNRELLVEEAKKQGVDKRADISRMIQIQSDSLLANTLLQEKLEGADTSDATLQAEYDVQIAKIADVKEFKASHILLKTEEDAKAVIEELAKGAVFADLAKEKSTGPSGPEGGDLGWFSAESMVPEFAGAVQTMTKGDISKEPVQTQFGWHVIYLDDSRTPEPPAFEDVKEQLKAIVASKQVEDFLQGLREKGNVELMTSADAPSAAVVDENKD